MTNETFLRVVEYGDMSLRLDDLCIEFSATDQQNTEDIFRQNNRQLSFYLFLHNQEISDFPDKFYLYLGRDPWHEWDWDYAIELQRHPMPPGSGSRFFWMAKHDDKTRIKNQYWCAATAKITLCDKNRLPVVTEANKVIQTTIGLGFNAWYEAVYQGVRSGLEWLNQQVNITTPFEQLLKVSRQVPSNPYESDALFLYLRIKDLLPTFTGCVDAILKSPAQKMIGLVKNFTTSSIFSPQYAIEAHRSFSSAISIQKTEILQSKVFPVAFSYYEGQSSCDIEENYLAYWCIERVKMALEVIKDELSRYILSSFKSAENNSGYHQRQLREEAQKHERELLKINHLISYCQKSLSALPISPKWNSIQHANNLSELINYDWRYSKLWKLANLIKDSVEFIDTSSEVIPFQVSPFQDSYEKWCLFQVCQALEKIGFSLISRGELTPFYKKPSQNSVFCEMHNPAQPGLHVKVFYERKYEPVDLNSDKYSFGFWAPLRNHLPPEERKRTPDIALEFYKDKRPYPLIFTLDPTLGGNWRNKYLYRETIRLNDGSSDGLSIVKAAWAITPGRDLEDGQRYVRMHDHINFCQGTITLNHLQDSQEKLCETLIKIIDKSGLFEH
jgi:hypothetical protein